MLSEQLSMSACETLPAFQLDTALLVVTFMLKWSCLSTEGAMTGAEMTGAMIGGMTGAMIGGMTGAMTGGMTGAMSETGVLQASVTVP